MGGWIGRWMDWWVGGLVSGWVGEWMDWHVDVVVNR